MLLASFPWTFVYTSVWEFVDSKTLSFILKILAFIFSLIRPLIQTFSMHLILFPFTFINSTISPSIDTVSVFESILITSLIFWTIIPTLNNLGGLRANIDTFGLYDDAFLISTLYLIWNYLWIILINIMLTYLILNNHQDFILLRFLLFKLIFRFRLELFLQLFDL